LPAGASPIRPSIKQEYCGNISQSAQGKNQRSTKEHTPQKKDTRDIFMSDKLWRGQENPTLKSQNTQEVTENLSKSKNYKNKSNLAK